MESTVLKDHRDQILTLTLNRPAKLNCINWEMMRQLDEELRFAEEIDDLKLLVVRGAGGRAFSTGGDLKEWRALDKNGVAHWIRMGQRILRRIELLPVLTLAVAEGYAYGGGLELALACDVRAATPSATFACPELQLGWPPGWGGLTRLGRLIGESNAKRMIFWGESVSAQEALRIGLVNWVIEGGEVTSFLEEALQKLERADPRVLSFSKSAISERSGGAGAREADLDADVMASLAARDLLGQKGPVFESEDTED